MGANFQAKPLSLISILCSITFLLIFITIPSVSALSAYDVLQQYDFPVGILPQGVVNYQLDKSSGEFKVELKGPCTFKINIYEVNYESTISCVITKDNISNLAGIQVKVESEMINITGITRIQDQLKVSAGTDSANVPVSFFNMSPACN